MGTEPERRLVALLFSDLVGYSKRMAADEHAALRLLEVHDRIMRATVLRHGGRVIKTGGDSFMVSFQSAVAAVTCALDALAEHAAHNSATPDDRIDVRMGVHAGDAFERDGDLFGDNVNLAARLEPQAPPGTVCVTEALFGQLVRKVKARAEDLGLRELKNMPAPVRLLALTPSPNLLDRPGPQSAAPSSPRSSRAVADRTRLSWLRRNALGIVVVAIVTVAAVYVWTGYRRQAAVSTSLRPDANQPAAPTSIEGTLRAHTDALNLGDLAAWRAMLDENVVFLDSARTGLVVGQVRTLEAVAAYAEAKASFAPDERVTRVGQTSQDAGWSFEECNVTRSARTDRLRLTKVFKRQHGRWLVVAMHWSIGISDETAAAWRRQGREPADVGRATPKEAANVVDTFLGVVAPQHAVRTLILKTASLSKHEELVAIGSDPDEHYLTTAASLAWYESLPGMMSADGGIRAGVIGDVAWVLTNLTYAIPKRAPILYRVLFVFLREESAWMLVQPPVPG